MDHLYVPGRAGAGAELQVEEHCAGLGDGDVDWNGDTLINMRIEIVPLLPCIFIRADGVVCAVCSRVSKTRPFYWDTNLFLLLSRQEIDVVWLHGNTHDGFVVV